MNIEEAARLDTVVVVAAMMLMLVLGSTHHDMATFPLTERLGSSQCQ